MERLKLVIYFTRRTPLQEDGEDEEVLSNVGVERLEAEDMSWKNTSQLSRFKISSCVVDTKVLSLTGSWV